ncbi:MAG: putative metal-binding motif-containing protein, partial [Deltaproteobacteria bacterium]|nr:putative metal-binding motif-containing protein [Deltaproteobacteria bacterium]
MLCRPCRLDADCAGTAQALCVEYGPQGRWCGIDCETAGCPAGFDCVDVPPGAGRQCRVAGADCPCDDEVAGLPTTCYVENAFGRCAAERTCEEDCPAPVPAAETCDGADDDCDGTTDEDATDCTMRYRDGDGDGWGVSSDSRCLCVGDAPYTAVSPGDCDDARPEVHPEAPELCNTRDDDCDAATDEGLGAASPGTGCATKGLCAGKVAAACVAGEWACDYTGVTGYQPGAETSCDAFDNDCDGATDEEFALDGPAGPLAIGVPCGTGACAGGKVRCRAAGDAAECSTAGLASAETCDQKDNDCDGVTDPPGLPGCATYYKDGDQDGYGEEGSAKCICFPAKPWTTKVPGDCDDANPQAHPSRKEDCATAFDDDCDGATDVQGATGCTKRYRDEDGDGWGTSDAQCWCGTPGTWRAPQPGDCDDADANVHPGGAVCGKDGSCDGLLTDAGEPCDDQNAVAWDGCNACNIVEFQVNSTATGAQGAVRLAHHGDAAFVAVWEDSGRDGAGYGIVGRRYMGDGSPVGGEFAVNTYTSGDQREPAVAGAAGQGFVAAWRSNGQDGAAGGVYAQRYAADGTAAGGEFRVNSWTTNTQSSPA